MKSTIEKGDKLENFAYEKFRQFILSNELPYVNQKCASLYKKKEYYSRDRGSNIVVDLSIELNFPGATKAASLCIIECKNYSSRVPVCDVEEFCSKIDQIAGKNVKGILVITSTLQEAAFKYAESKNIGVLRVKINEGVEWLLYRKSRSYEDISNDNNLYKKSFIDPDVPTPAGIIGCNHGVCYLDVNKFIVSAFIDLGFSFQKNKDQHNEMINEFSVPYLLNEEIETKAYSIIENMRKSYGQVAIMTPIEYYVKYLKDVYGCELFFNLFLGYNEKEQEILGSISFFEKKIFISSSLKENNSRLRFTLAHEMGHIILHTDIYKKRGFKISCG